MTRVASKIVFAFFAVSLLISAPAFAAKGKTTEDAYRAQQIADPIEPINRFIFGFNNILDIILIEPVARGYRAVVPTVARDAVQSFMRNLRSPLQIANNLLQGDLGAAGVSTARFLINTTAGLGGLVDVASIHGLEYRYEDFGQTLGRWGAGPGFYLVLPIWGPSSLRDAVGLGVDTYADPVRIIAKNSGKDWIYYTREGLEGIDFRARMIDVIDDMRRNSLDYYATARSAYTQRRAALIRNDRLGAAVQMDEDDHP